MPKGYVILTEAIRDLEGMKAYGKAAMPAMGQGGCTMLAVDRAPHVLEGDWHGDQTVVLEFEAYQKAAKLRQAAADCNAVIISGSGD